MSAPGKVKAFNYKPWLNPKDIQDRSRNAYTSSAYSCSKTAAKNMGFNAKDCLEVARTALKKAGDVWDKHCK